MDKKNNSGNSRPTQFTVIFRLAAGGYLIYLSYGLAQEFFKNTGDKTLLQLFFIAVFFGIGAALAGWSLIKLVRGEYTRPGDTTDSEAKDDDGEQN